MRKTFTAEFKAKVGLEAVRGEKTVQEIGTLYEVHPNQVSDWKKQVLTGAAELFAKKERAKTDAAATEQREQELYAQVGKLSVQVEFLKKKYRQLFGSEPDL
jgi:transposase-like protein